MLLITEVFSEKGKFAHARIKWEYWYSPIIRPFAFLTCFCKWIVVNYPVCFLGKVHLGHWLIDVVDSFLEKLGGISLLPDSFGVRSSSYGDVFIITFLRLIVFVFRITGGANWRKLCFRFLFLFPWSNICFCLEIIFLFCHRHFCPIWPQLILRVIWNQQKTFDDGLDKKQ